MGASSSLGPSAHPGHPTLLLEHRDLGSGLDPCGLQLPSLSMNLTLDFKDDFLFAIIYLFYIKLIFFQISILRLPGRRCSSPRQLWSAGQGLAQGRLSALPASVSSPAEPSHPLKLPPAQLQTVRPTAPSVLESAKPCMSPVSTRCVGAVLGLRGPWSRLLAGSLDLSLSRPGCLSPPALPRLPWVTSLFPRQENPTAGQASPLQTPFCETNDRLLPASPPLASVFCQLGFSQHLTCCVPCRKPC